MAPKRTRAQVSSGEQLPGRQTSTRNDKKKSPIKRRKMAKAAAKPKIAVIEEEQETPSADCDSDEEQEPETTEPSPASTKTPNGASTQPRPKHVHFDTTSSAVLPDGRSDTRLEKTTATHITPHLRKMGIKRRVSSSPSVCLSSLAKRIKINPHRTSLPTTRSEIDEENVYIREEQRFAPLREVLKDHVNRRTEQRAAREARIYELELESETETQLENFERVQEIEEELEALRQEQTPSLSRVGQESVGMPDEDMMVLNGRDALVSPRLLASDDDLWIDQIDSEDFAREEFDNSSPVQSETQHSAWNTERRNFEDAVLALSQESNDAKAKLEILEAELQALGFSEQGTTSAMAFLSIRESFDRARESLRSVLQDFVSDDVSNRDVLEILTANGEDLAERLQIQDKELLNKNSLVADLGSQVHGLLDHLAEAEIRKQTLERRRHQLDENNEAKDRDIEQLRRNLGYEKTSNNVYRLELEEKTTETEELQVENAELGKNIERLTRSLQRYRDEEARLTELITRMEDDQKLTVSKLGREREETIQDLQDRHDEETRRWEEVGELCDSRQTTIAYLEMRVEKLETEKDALCQYVGETLQKRDEDRGNLIAPDYDSQGDCQDSESLEDRINELEDLREHLHDTVQRLREMYGDEPTQREDAETNLKNVNLDFSRVCNMLQEVTGDTTELRRELAEARNPDKQHLIHGSGELDVEMRAAITKRDDRINELETCIIRGGDQLDNLQKDLIEAEDLDDDSICRAPLYHTHMRRRERTVRTDEVTEDTDQEAVHDLQSSIEGEDEVQSLKAAMHNKQAQIRIIEQKAREADRRWEEVLNARDEEVSNLQTSNRQQEREIGLLTAQVEAIKSSFHDYVDRSLGRMSNFQKALADTQAVAEAERSDAEEDSVRVLEEIETPRQSIQFQQMTSEDKSSGRRRRPVDSGIGLDMEGEMEEMM